MPDAEGAPLQDDLTLLVGAARTAADLALGFFKRDPKVWHKANASPVSEADLAVDSHLKTVLLAARPDYGWLSEETEDDTARLACRRLFVVDPIDGTRGFLAGSDEWTISLAVVEAGRPVAAVLIQPTTGLLYSATTGGGAFLDGVPLRLQPHTPDRGFVAGPTVLVNRLRGSFPGLQPCGYVASLALRLAYVAEGRLDLALAKANAHDWDLAAADLILTEAGGRLSAVGAPTIVYNRPTPTHGTLVAARPDLSDRILSLLQTP